jgi:predicted Rossmann-fold nucleotide-binding protein
MRVLVCGGRDYKNRGQVFAALDRLMAKHGALTIIEGGAVGADTFAGEWICMQRSCQLVTEHATWEKYGKPAGPIRNQKMIDDHKPNLVIAFPGGRGTADMVFKAQGAGVEVTEVP